MQHEILSWREMCRREGRNLQRGLHFRCNPGYCVALMTLRPGGPYADQTAEEDATLFYQGHDRWRSPDCPDPAAVDQPEFTAQGFRTQNGKFYCAALEFKHGYAPAELVKVYQKLLPGIWAYKGLYRLTDGRKDRSAGRLVFVFRLEREELAPAEDQIKSATRSIPRRTKLAVWKRDQGRCVLCGGTKDLHFDHIIPFSKGGASRLTANVQLLCSRHNLTKADAIM